PPRPGSRAIPIRAFATSASTPCWWRRAAFPATSPRRSTRAVLRRVELREEPVNLVADAGGDLAEVLGHGLDRARALPRRRRRLAHPLDLGRGLDRALGRGLDAARDLLGGGALLGDGGGDRARDIADLADGVLDGADRLDRARGGVLHAGDLRADVLGRPRGLPGERLDLAGDDREA